MTCQIFELPSVKETKVFQLLYVKSAKLCSACLRELSFSKCSYTFPLVKWSSAGENGGVKNHGVKSNSLRDLNGQLFGG